MQREPIVRKPFACRFYLGGGRVVCAASAVAGRCVVFLPYEAPPWAALRKGSSWRLSVRKMTKFVCRNYPASSKISVIGYWDSSNVAKPLSEESQYPIHNIFKGSRTPADVYFRHNFGHTKDSTMAMKELERELGLGDPAQGERREKIIALLGDRLAPRLVWCLKRADRKGATADEVLHWLRLARKHIRAALGNRWILSTTEVLHVLLQMITNMVVAARNAARAVGESAPPVQLSEPSVAGVLKALEELGGEAASFAAGVKDACKGRERLAPGVLRVRRRGGHSYGCVRPDAPSRACDAQPPRNRAVAPRGGAPQDPAGSAQVCEDGSGTPRTPPRRPGACAIG